MTSVLLSILLAAVAGAPGHTPPTAAGQDWMTRARAFRSKYYSIKCDFSPEDAKLMAEHVDSTFESYMRLFSRLPVHLQRPATLDLYLFSAEEDYHKVLKVLVGDEGLGSWGTCISRGNRITLVGWRGDFSLEQMKPLLQHEGFHQLARHLFTDLPPWADEGLAELFERGIMVDGRLVLGEVTARDRQRLLEAIDQQRTLPLDRLFTASQSYWIRSVRALEADAIYMQAWSLVHFLIFAEQGKYETAFLNFLVQLNRRVEWRQAFVAAFGMPDFKVLQTKWLEYARTTPPSDYRETVRRLAFLAAGMTELHKQGRRPTSLETLRQQLQEIRFEFRSDLFGQERRLSAADPRMFEVPYAEGLEQRKFTLWEPRGATGNNPTPCTITAGGLDPQLFSAQWKRQGRESAYVLAVSPAVQQNAKHGRKK